MPTWTGSCRRDGVQLAAKFGIDRSGGDDKRVIRGERGYVEQNVAALDVTLSDSELAVLDPLGAQVTGARY
jgi:hypothetical protein